jgi:5-(carboxyamino)imidazole ribonucleotide mutase
MSAAVGIVMGSESDRATMDAAGSVLERFGIPYEIEVMSAHRAPARVAEYAAGAAERGLKVIIAGAGMAAHLPGVVAAHTTLPVIGVPLLGKALAGADALYSCVQMPPGVPVATVGVDGAKNAAVLACQMLALADASLAGALADLKRDLARGHKL